MLPPFAPPCWKYDAFGRHARVSYFVEVVGSRSGTLSRKRRIRVPILVLPQDIEGKQIARSLCAPEPQQLPLTSVTEKKIRRGLFGEQASVRMEVSDDH